MPIQKTADKSTPNYFICDCEDDMRQACARERFYKEKEGKLYCVLHYPGDEKAEYFQERVNDKIDKQDFNFRGVWFPKGVRFKEPLWTGNTDFSYAVFNEEIDFSGVDFFVKALFKNASFNARVNFKNTKFHEGADFSEVCFAEETDFDSATFGMEARRRVEANPGEEVKFDKEAIFTKARFSRQADFFFASFYAKADFDEATFSADAKFGLAKFYANAIFNDATFGATADFRNDTFDAEADFISAKFKDLVRFEGSLENRELGKLRWSHFSGHECVLAFTSFPH